MIKTIIKRNKQKEPFSAEKLNGWGIWAAGNLGKYVNWPEVILETVAKLPQEISAIDLPAARELVKFIELNIGNYEKTIKNTLVAASV